VAEVPAAGALSVPPGKGITHCLIQREAGPNWITCEWFMPELKGYQRRLVVADGLDVQQWILERFGSGKYRLAFYRNSRAAGYSSPWECVDPDRPQQAHKIGAPVVGLPAAPPVPTAAWGPPVAANYAPTWLQAQELQERAAERERAASLERLQAIRADEDERRDRREREEEARRKRDQEEADRRLAGDRARAAVELDGLRERHKLDLERMRMDHEFRMQAAAAETARGNPAEDWADALEAVEERLAERFAEKPAKPSEVGQFLQAIQPHVPAVIQVLQNLGRAVAARAPAPAAPPAAPWPPPEGPAR